MKNPYLTPPLNTKIAPNRLRGPAGLPSTIKPTDSAMDYARKSNKPTKAQIAMMTSDQLKQALGRWPDLLGE